MDFLIHWPPGPVVATVQCQGMCKIVLFICVQSVPRQFTMTYFCMLISISTRVYAFEEIYPQSRQLHTSYRVLCFHMNSR